MHDLWPPLQGAQWRSTPCITGRQATVEDVRAGRAVFYVEGESTPFEMKLPCCGWQRLADGEEVPVVVIQAETGPTGTLLGVRPLNGGNGVCMAEEVRLLPAGFES